MNDATEIDLAKLLEAKLSRLGQLRDQCAERLLRVTEMYHALDEIRDTVEAAIPKESRAYRVFDRLRSEKISQWRAVGRPGADYVTPQQCQEIEKWREILSATLQEVNPAVPPGRRTEQSEHFFAEGEAYASKRFLLELMKRAGRSLGVVDEYLDEDALDFVAALNGSIEVRLITGRKKRTFPQLIRALVSEGRAVAARYNSRCHDRFLILDRNEVWRLGASINGFGKKAFMINKVEDNEELSKLMNKFEEWWQGGDSV